MARGSSGLGLESMLQKRPKPHQWQRRILKLLKHWELLHYSLKVVQNETMWILNCPVTLFRGFGFSDSWISQSASFPRNQKQRGVDSLTPVASLPKQIFQPSVQQQPPKPPKITCANCKNPLQKGQTAYQRKGSAHLFCSTSCLSSFSHKPAPKKLCVMCKK